MNKVELKKDIYWVGGIDWELRDFHGYLTQRGSSYNSYLVIDEKVTLIDATKIGNKDELFKRISMIIDPSKIDVIICNHIEMDHSGCIPEFFLSNIRFAALPLKEKYQLPKMQKLLPYYDKAQYPGSLPKISKPW